MDKKIIVWFQPFFHRTIVFFLMVCGLLVVFFSCFDVYEWDTNNICEWRDGQPISTTEAGTNFVTISFSKLQKTNVLDNARKNKLCLRPSNLFD